MIKSLRSAENEEVTSFYYNDSMYLFCFLNSWANIRYKTVLTEKRTYSRQLKDSTYKWQDIVDNRDNEPVHPVATNAESIPRAQLFVVSVEKSLHCRRQLANLGEAERKSSELNCLGKLWTSQLPYAVSSKQLIKFSKKRQFLKILVINKQYFINSFPKKRKKNA